MIKTSHKCFTLLACLVLPLSVQWQTHAGEPPNSRSVDRYGDPLPPGAVARLGTLRFVHLGEISSAAVSPDGKVVASGVTRGKEIYLNQRVLQHGDGFKTKTVEWVTLSTIRLWDADQGTLIREIATPDAPVSCLQFASDGRSLFAGCGRFLCAWDTATGKQLWQKEGVSDGRFNEGTLAERLVLIKDKIISLHAGRLVCPVSVNRGSAFYYHPQLVIRLWDRRTGQPLPTPEALQSSIKAEGGHIATLFQDAAVSADGRFAAVLASRGDPQLPTDPNTPADRLESWKYSARRLILVDLATGKICHTFPGGKDEVKRGDFDRKKLEAGSLAFSDDGSTLAVAAEGEVTLVQTASGRKRLLAKGLQTEGTRLAFLGLTQLVAQLSDGQKRAWDVVSCKERDPEPTQFQAFLPAHNGRIAAAAHGNTVRVTDLRSSKEIPQFEGHRLTPLVWFARHSREMLFSSDEEGARLWDTKSWNQKKALAIPKGLPKDKLSYNPETRDATVSWETGLYLREGDKRLELWDFKTNRLIRPLPATVREMDSPSFCVSGNRIVVRSKDSYQFLDVETGKTLSQLPRSKMEIFRPNIPVISPGGTYFAQVETNEDGIDLHDVSSGRLMRSLTLRPSPRQKIVCQFHFSADEKILAAEVHELISVDGETAEKVSIALWDVQSGELFQEMVVAQRTYTLSRWGMSMNEHQVGPVALSHDGRLVALAKTGGKDVEVWETASGTRRGVLVGHEGPVRSLSFSADDKHLASGSDDTTVLVWDMHRPLLAKDIKGCLKGEELATHWKTLARVDGPDADRAIWSLVRAPQDAIPFLKQRLRPVARAEAGRLRKLLADLDNEDYETRAAANAEIEGLGDQVLGELQKALQGKNDPEKQARLESLLEKAKDAPRRFGTPAKLQMWRALEVLEKAATPDAIGLLTDLAGGAPGAWLTREASAALGRLGAQAKRDQ